MDNEVFIGCYLGYLFAFAMIAGTLEDNWLYATAGDRGWKPPTAI